MMLILLPLQSEGGMSFLVMLVPCDDTDTLDEDSEEPINTETLAALEAVSAPNEMLQDLTARVSQ
jgi:hypothetical protein